MSLHEPLTDLHRQVTAFYFLKADTDLGAHQHVFEEVIEGHIGEDPEFNIFTYQTGIEFKAPFSGVVAVTGDDEE